MRTPPLPMRRRSRPTLRYQRQLSSDAQSRPEKPTRDQDNRYVDGERCDV